MKYLILKVRNKSEINRLSEFSSIVYVSKFMNTIGIEIQESKVYLLDNDPNIISYRDSREGEYQPHVLSYC